MPARNTDATPKRSTRAGAATTSARAALAVAESEPADDAARAVLLLVARALDEAAASKNPYAVAALSGRALELLRELRMTPASRGPAPDADPYAELFAALREPALRDSPQP